MLHVARAAHVVVWTIDRPETKNALDLKTMNALEEAIAVAHQDQEIRVAILTGANGAFVSGGDLVEWRNKTTVEDARMLSERGDILCRAIESLPFPVIAVLSGHTLGGGAELALACDVRIAEKHAKIGFVQAQMGVTPAWGSISRLIYATSASSAARLLLFGTVFSACDARALGMIDEVVDEGDGLVTASAWAKKVSRCSPTAIAETKKLLVAARAHLREKMLPLERDAFVRMWSGDDHREAVEAYFEDRKPHFGVREDGSG